VQQHTRGQRHEQQDKVEIHSDVHYVYSFLRNLTATANAHFIAAVIFLPLFT
jgi:hypothetical protein